MPKSHRGAHEPAHPGPVDGDLPLPGVDTAETTAGRVRAVFGNGAADPLPGVNEDTLAVYQRYLCTHLTFPFEGHFDEETGHLGVVEFPVIVHRLKEPGEGGWCDAQYGLMCEAAHKLRPLDVPLSQITAVGRTPNRHLIQDYAWWLSRQ